MKNSIKEYAGCIIPLTLFIGFIAFLFYTNNKNTEKAEVKSKIGKYAYVDVNETIHLLRYCPAIGKQPGELGGAERTVTRIPIENVTLQMLDYSCSRCVSDDDYERLVQMASD